MLSLSHGDFECCVGHRLQIELESLLLQGSHKLLSLYFDFTSDISSLATFLALYCIL